MPTDTSAPAEVVQADRDAAADFYGPHLARPGEVWVTAHMRAGKVDDSALIQAFARHRLNAQPLAADALDAGRASEDIERDIRCAIWNAGMNGGMGQDLSQAFIRRAMDEPTMKRALAALSSGKTVGAGEGGLALQVISARKAIYETKRDESDALADDDCNRWERMQHTVEALEHLETEVEATLHGQSSGKPVGGPLDASREGR